MNKRYYLVIIDLLFMFVVVLIIALMSISYEKHGKSNTNYNSIVSLEKQDPSDQRNEFSYIAIKLYTDKFSIFQVTPENNATFVKHFYDISSFANSQIYLRNVNYVLFDDDKSPFLGDLIRILNRTGRNISIAGQ